MKNNIIIALITLIVGLAIGFFAGQKYTESQRFQTQFPFRMMKGNGNGQGGRFGENTMTGRNGFRPVSGEIIDTDDNSITVKLADGSTKIVILSDKTNINKAARFELSGIDREIRYLTKLLKFGVVQTSSQSDYVDFGSRVIVSDGKKELDFTLVGSYESDPSRKLLSVNSPIGKALKGKRVGDTFFVSSPSGIHTYTLKNITS